MERYRTSGIKLTPQRLAILEFLEENISHPSAEEIYKAVKKRFPTMSFATVYNTLETLKARGRLQEITIDPARRRYDPDTSAHHHIICTGCGRVFDVRMKYRPELPPEQAAQFRITGSHIDFYGLCPVCSKDKHNKEATNMTVFKCDKCSATKEGRCKPKKCPECGSEGTMKKQ